MEMKVILLYVFWMRNEKVPWLNFKKKRKCLISLLKYVCVRVCVYAKLIHKVKRQIHRICLWAKERHHRPYEYEYMCSWEECNHRSLLNWFKPHRMRYWITPVIHLCDVCWNFRQINQWNMFIYGGLRYSMLQKPIIALHTMF